MLAVKIRNLIRVQISLKTHHHPRFRWYIGLAIGESKPPGFCVRPSFGNLAATLGWVGASGWATVYWTIFRSTRKHRNLRNFGSMCEVDQVNGNIFLKSVGLSLEFPWQIESSSAFGLKITKGLFSHDLFFGVAVFETIVCQGKVDGQNK